MLEGTLYELPTGIWLELYASLRFRPSALHRARGRQNICSSEFLSNRCKLHYPVLMLFDIRWRTH